MSAKTSKVAIMDRYPDAARATRPILWPRVRQYTVSDIVGGVLVTISYSSGVHRTPAGTWAFAMTVLTSEHLAYSNQAPFAYSRWLVWVSTRYIKSRSPANRPGPP
jgi:hypothetical protein